MMSQFLRLKAAAGLMADGAGVSVRELRDQLAAGEGVEVAGYALSSEFVAQMDALEFARLDGVGEVHWVQIGRAEDKPPPAAQRILDKLAARDIDCRFHAIAGDPFWATAEIATVPGLSELTGDLLAGTG